MLCELNIRNFVIIDQLSLRFGAGFNVLTGETGAGKSIIIDAIDLLLGGKARPDLIRSGEDEAWIEAVFDISRAPQLRVELDDAGLGNGDELLVRRILARSGKNRIYVNGSLATVAQLQQLVPRIVAIYGQHEQMGLARPELHLALLDRFADLAAEFDDYRVCFERIRTLEDELQQLQNAERERQQRLDLLTFQQREIGAATLRIGEDDELIAERTVVQHAERLGSASAAGYETLYGAEGAVCERLSQVVGVLRELTRIDPALGQMAETIEAAYFSLEDVALQLRDYAEKIAFDPVRLDQIEQRLGQLATLKRKYGADLAEVLAYLGKIEEEGARLLDIDGTRDHLHRDLAALKGQLTEIGSRISAARHSAAQQLQLRVAAELADLAMGKARFQVRMMPLSTPGARGFERVEFMLQANPGEDARPLARVASGGELSRLMLAIRRAAPVGDELTTMIFDEVDAGIGGVAATAVGEKLRDAAQGRQVLCITHLPQVAAFAEHHFRVNKLETDDARTRAEVLLLADEDRVAEMARMLGGAKITEQSLAHARELIHLSLHQHDSGGAV